MNNLNKIIISANSSRYAFRVSFVYAVSALLWIISSNALNYLRNMEELDALLYDVVAGLTFCIITSVILFITLRKSHNSISDKNKEISKNKNKYVNLVENIDVYVSRFDLDKRYTYLNNFAKKIFNQYGRNEKEIIGKKPTELGIDFETALNIEKEIERIISDKVTYDDKFSYGNFHYKMKLIPEFDSSGNIESVLSILFDVSDIENSKIELSKKTNYLNTIIEASPLAVFDLNKDGVVASIWNKASEKMFGWTPEEAIGKYLPIIQKNKRQEFESRISKGFEGEHLYLKNVLRKKKSGEDISINISTCPVPGDSNDIVRILAFVEDVTQDKIYEEEIRKLSEAIKQSPNSLIITDLQSKIIYVNPYFTELTGFSFDEAIGKDPMELLQGKINIEVRNEINDLLSSGKVWKGESLNTKKNGEQYWASVSIGSVKDESGKMIYSVGIEQDITEKKLYYEKLQKVLNEKEEMLKQIHKLSEALKQNPNSFMITSTDSIIEYVNPAFTQQTGYTFEDAVGKHPMILLRGEIDAMIGKEIGETISSGNVWKGELCNKKKSGEVYWSSVQIGPIKDENGNMINCVGIEQDITEKKLKDKQLEESLLEKEIMLKEIHHRVKNNMQIVSSLLNMQSDICSNPDTLDALNITKNRILSMALVHENLYRSDSISRIKISSYAEMLARNIYFTYGASTERINLIVNTNGLEVGLDTSIPVGLILNELLSNSLKHAFPGDMKGEITVECKKTDPEFISLCVRDNGIGLKANFDTGANSSLGIHLIKLLAEQLDGELTIKGYEGCEVTLRFKEIRYKQKR